jgi:hypothetical protein
MVLEVFYFHSTSRIYNSNALLISCCTYITNISYRVCLWSIYSAQGNTSWLMHGQSAERCITILVLDCDAYLTCCVSYRVVLCVFKMFSVEKSAHLLYSYKACIVGKGHWKFHKKHPINSTIPQKNIQSIINIMNNRASTRQKENMKMSHFNWRGVSKSTVHGATKFLNQYKITVIQFSP